MAIQSTFYDTSPGVPASLVTEVKWAKAHPHVGSSEYGVDAPGDFQVTAHPSTPFTVNVSPGKAWGHGVLDESSAIVPVTCDTPAAGTTRWDLIVIRRDWTAAPGVPSAVTKVNGGTTKAIPAARNNTPGTLDDQPLFLVQWVAGQTQPNKIVDVRVWAGNGGMFAKDELVRSYLTRIGSSVKLNGETWSLDLLGNDLPGWVNEDGSGPWVKLTLKGGWANNGSSFARVRTVGRGAFLHVSADVRYTVSATIFEGWIIADLPAGLRPIEQTYVPGTTNSYTSGTFYGISSTGITVGPAPVGVTCQLNGLAALK